MPIVAALRRLLDRKIDVMVADGQPGVRIIAMTWKGTDFGLTVGPGAERTVSTDEGNAGLLKALSEIEDELQ